MHMHMNNERQRWVQADAMVQDRLHERVVYLSCSSTLSLAHWLSVHLTLDALLSLLLPELVGDSLYTVKEVAVL